jgi:hypothetical protein
MTAMFVPRIHRDCRGRLGRRRRLGSRSAMLVAWLLGPGCSRRGCRLVLGRMILMLGVILRRRCGMLVLTAGARGWSLLGACRKVREQDGHGGQPDDAAQTRAAKQSIFLGRGRQLVVLGALLAPRKTFA